MEKTAFPFFKFKISLYLTKRHSLGWSLTPYMSSMIVHYDAQSSQALIKHAFNMCTYLACTNYIIDNSIPSLGAHCVADGAMADAGGHRRGP